MSTCTICGNTLPPATRAEPPRYCSGACRQKAYRQRHKTPFPLAMRQARRWARSDGKRPIQPDGTPASSTDPGTWHTFANVQTGAGDGYGFMLGDGFACWDLDHCLHDGQITNPLARQVIDGIGEQWTYQEISVSGQGLHIFVHSTSPSYKTKNIEYYSHSRYIKTTGNTRQQAPPPSNTR
ncbi:MAG: hypothetical protein LKI30_04215 [Bifidobacterium crudilactis]|nr:hypothetical protein [Bifidobacterium crudilactis]